MESRETALPVFVKSHALPQAEFCQLGATFTQAGVRYCAWSPESRLVEVEIGFQGGTKRVVALESAGEGYHLGLDAEGRAGDWYKFRLDGGESFPDPASRAQAESVHGPSIVVDAQSYKWHDAAWRRPEFRDLVIYELHIGTFTLEGTFAAAIAKLPHLQALGINAIELMPIADFPGARNWGYDGVLIYAPARAYGTPDDLRRLVDAAHAHGIAVILDVVYNHFGPDGNYLARFSPAFFNPAHHTPWGASFNFDGARSRPVRDFFVQNPIYWMEEFHLDGFRLDATHAIIDDSPRHIFAEITEAIHARGGYAVAEDARNDARLIEPVAEGGHGFDGVWADDFHHVLRVSQTGEQAAYFENFRGTTEELVETLRHGWLYRGQPALASGKSRGTACRHLPPERFIHCISNHDQAGNRAFGERLHASVSAEGYRALAMLLCLSPGTPMLFMGQEWAATSPFLFFTDHHRELGRLITEGRRREFAGFPEFGDGAALEKIPDPQEARTFLRSKLDWTELGEERHAQMLALHAACLRLRREESAFRPRTRDGWEADALRFGVGALRLESAARNYLLVFDLAGSHAGSLAGEKVAREGGPWERVLSSNEVRFGGAGAEVFEAATQTFRFGPPETLLLRDAGKSGGIESAQQFPTGRV